jgi:ligand-binding sensor domain-containing protein
MKRFVRWCMIISLLALTVGCSGQEKGKEKGKQPAPVTASHLAGELTYQDVLEKGETINVLSMTEDGKSIWIGTHAGIYCSVNNGLWALLSGDLEDDDVTAWFADPQQPEHIFAAGNGVMKRSLDGGKSWQSVGKGLPPSPNIRGLTGTREGNRLRLFGLVSGEGVYQSADGGENWKLWLPLDQEVYAMDYSPKRQRIFVATQYGLLYNHGEQWEAEPLADVEQIYSLAVDRRDDSLYIATEHGIMHNSDGEWKVLSARAPEKLIAISAGVGDYTLVGIGESAFIYSLSNDKWSNWE